MCKSDVHTLKKSTDYAFMLHGELLGNGMELLMYSAYLTFSSCTLPSCVSLLGFGK